MNCARFRILLFGLAPWMLWGCAGTLTPSHQDPAQYTRLDAAVEDCNLSRVKVLIEENPASVNEPGWSNTSPLHLAASDNCTQVAVFLIDHGANVNAKAKGDVTPLHIAAQKGNLDLVKILLSHKADAHAVDAQGRSPGDRALQWGHPEVARFLNSL
jgi:ankyrin repeat protein